MHREAKMFRGTVIFVLGMLLGAFIIWETKSSYEFGVVEPGMPGQILKWVFPPGSRQEGSAIEWLDPETGVEGSDRCLEQLKKSFPNGWALDTGNLVSTKPAESWTLSITEDGQLEINGKPIEKMSHPELKTIMREIADGFKAQYEWRDMCCRQTDYLLRELEACQKQRQEILNSTKKGER